MSLNACGNGLYLFNLLEPEYVIYNIIFQYVYPWIHKYLISVLPSSVGFICISNMTSCIHVLHLVWKWLLAFLFLWFLVLT